jgi:hypothetical protein
MKVLNSEIEQRLHVKLDKSIKDDDVTGIMKFGENNDYPQVIEKIIMGSQTGKAVAGILAKFISGDGFVNEAIGKEVVGKDNKGKPIVLDNIRRLIADSISKFNGVYIHCNESLEGKVINTKVLPFKYCRLSREDDNGYCGKIAVHPNWSKESDLKTFKLNEITWFTHFNLDPNVLAKAVNEAGNKGFKGQIYSLFIDDTYLYPLSPLDSVYLDMDTENQIQLFKNREIRNGFSDKIIFNIAPSEDSKEQTENVKKIQGWMGPDGEKALIFESEFDESGDLKKDGSFKTTEIKTNINDKLFEGWEKSLANNIRKAAKGMPAILIDYEMGTLGAASGEMIIQATEYYNALTAPLREAMAEVFKDIYSHHTSEVLNNNTDWTLKPATLVKKEINANDAEADRKKAQAQLRGSVGGVTSLIALQQSVSAGTSDLEAAVATVVEIYGIPDATARKMIGTPKPSNINYTPAK